MGIWQTVLTSCSKATGYPRPQKTTITEFGYSATKLFMMGMTALMMRMKRISFFPRKLLPLQISIAADAAVPPPRQATAAPCGQIRTAGSEKHRPGVRLPQRSGQRSSQRPSSANRSRRRSKKKGFDPYDLLRPAVIFLIILVIVLAAMGLFKLFGGKNDKKRDKRSVLFSGSYHRSDSSAGTGDRTGAIDGSPEDL